MQIILSEGIRWVDGHKQIKNFNMSRHHRDYMVSNGPIFSPVSLPLGINQLFTLGETVRAISQSSSFYSYF